MLVNNQGTGFGQAGRSAAVLLPANITEKEFGKVYVIEDGDNIHIEFTIRQEDTHEGWKTGIALDASSSMTNWFGRSLKTISPIPDSVLREYKNKGWITSRKLDGQNVTTYSEDAYTDAISNGYMEWTPNIVEPVVRNVTAYLANELDLDGKTTIAYWACGDAGKQHETLGEFLGDECKVLRFSGPEKLYFGNQTHLFPILKYFVDKFKMAKRTMLVFITDGKLDDLNAVKAYTRVLAKEIANKECHPVKCVLLGVGKHIDVKQMEELDDLETGTDIDIWDHKIAEEMRDLDEIIVELVDGSKVIAPLAHIYDANDNIVAHFTDGLPVTASFTMPKESSHFVLDVAGHKVKQSITTI